MGQFWCTETWPPSSPDLNPLDFFIWGTLETETNKNSNLTEVICSG
uniref:Uncharacterized protein n=1 Tax=Lepeophtheirus salmonis TaxID=72036 RepID=A0A0K2V2Z9_LEPSM